MEATTQEEYSHCSDSEEDCDAGKQLLIEYKQYKNVTIKCAE